MPTERVQYLVQRFFENTATPAEREELAAWVNTQGHDDALRNVLEQSWQQHTPSTEMPEDMSQRLLAAMFREEDAPVPVRRLSLVKRLGWWAAAAAVLILSIVGWWWLRPSPKPSEVVQNMQPAPIPPGSDGAILTLADGRTITLDSLHNGVVTNQGNTSISLRNGQLVYDASHTSGAPVASAITYNTMTTPRGRQFRLTLPDGTTVWLNAASSITYPTVFTGDNRKVSITGEAYFEVAHDKTKPFHVAFTTTGRSPQQGEIEVLGTHFNVNAYDDNEEVKATLLEGSVKVSVNGSPKPALLSPGQQASLVNNNIDVDKDVNVEEVMAWKNGLFFFRSAGLPQIMKQLSRWYNIEVQYQGKVPTLTINGKMDRGLHLNEVMDFLSKMDVHYTISGRTVIINGN